MAILYKYCNTTETRTERAGVNEIDDENDEENDENDENDEENDKYEEKIDNVEDDEDEGPRADVNTECSKDLDLQQDEEITPGGMAGRFLVNFIHASKVFILLVYKQSEHC